MSAHDVYVSRDELRTAVGVKTGADESLDLNAVLGTVWVQFRVGELLQADNVPVESPLTLTVVPTTAGRKAAALAAAVRFYNSPQAPFGVLGGLDDAAVFVNGRAIPEAELALQGEHVTFGIA